MTTSWPVSHTVRHPWFGGTLKRKRKSIDSLGEASTEEPSHHSKRVRCNTLEHGFAHLNIAPTQPSSFPPPTTPADSPISFSQDEDIINVDTPMDEAVLPTSIEEPTSFPSDDIDIRMTSSWYEPEKDRIVVTDLDGSDDEEDVKESQYTISPALLRRLRQQRAILPTNIIPPTSTQANSSNALVLFRPLNFAAPPNNSVNIEVKEEPPYDTDDLMDVET